MNNIKNPLTEGRSVRGDESDSSEDKANTNVPLTADAKTSGNRQAKLDALPPNTTPKRKRGRPKKCAPAPETADELSAEEESESYAEPSDDEEAQCVPNGVKFIECFICAEHMTRIYKLRAHMKTHEQADSYDERWLEASPIYEILNPHKRNIATSVIRDFIVGEIREGSITQFYAIFNEAGLEQHHSDSETDTEAEEQQASQEQRDLKEAFKRCNSYNCDLCAQTFTRRYKAYFHQYTTHAEADLPYECEFCGRRFAGVQLLIHHLKTICESDELPIACEERFRQYLLKVNLEEFNGLAQARKELKVHRLSNAEKIYACDICQKKFLRSEHLTRHKAVHMPDAQKMECPVCFKKFNRKDNLRTHMKVHLDEAERDTSNDQQILCQYCGHCFTSKSNYVVHMRRHTGEKPYVCDFCGKGFPKSTDLNSHKITHTGERKFSCKICNKTFGRQSVLSKHMRVHMGPYHCTYCNQSFLRPNELANHLRQHLSGGAAKKASGNGTNVNSSDAAKKANGNETNVNSSDVLKDPSPKMPLENAETTVTQPVSEVINSSIDAMEAAPIAAYLSTAQQQTKVVSLPMDKW